MNDLRLIHRYIAQDSRRAADMMVRRLRTESMRLAPYPESGRVVPEFGDPQYRELIVAPYRLIYRYHRDIDHVQALMVVHGSRMLPPLPDEGRRPAYRQHKRGDDAPSPRLSSGT